MRVAPRAASVWQPDSHFTPSRGAAAEATWSWCFLKQPLPAVLVQRLKSRAQFQAVLAGQTVARSVHFALHQLVLPGVAAIEPAAAGAEAGSQRKALPTELQSLFCCPGVWMGAMVPKRWAKRAVTRNAIKRQIYAVTSEYAIPLQSLNAAYVVRLRSGLDRKQFVSASSERLKSAMRAELLNLFQQWVSRTVARKA